MSGSDPLPALGLIAGSRSLPLSLAREARASGVGRLVAVAFEGETDPALAGLVDEIVWLRVGQLDRMIRAFADRGIRHCVMAGQIAPGNLFDLRPDFRAIKLLWRLEKKNAHTIFGAIGDELAKEGVELIEATRWLRSMMPDEGFRIGRTPSEDEQSDLTFGYGIAKEISRLEIGQTVVVKGGTVLAVEGFEGTDPCLRRGGELAGKERGAVAVKVAKRNHDLRFDIPCVGARTLEVCAASGIRVLGFEAGRTLLLEREQLDALADRLKVSLVAVGNGAGSTSAD